MQQISLLSIGEFGKVCDLSGDKKLFDAILALFQSDDEETKQYASTALGDVCLVSNYFLFFHFEKRKNFITKIEFFYLLYTGKC